MDKQRGKIDHFIFPHGQEPDPRFTLANERTFLAWIRTSLAFLAGGIALTAFKIPGLPPLWQEVGAVAVVGVALLIAVGAAVRWVRIERAMRVGNPLPVPLIVPLLALACALGAAIIFIGLIL